MATKRPPGTRRMLSAPLAQRVAENDAAARPRRKNYELDQRRIDLVKAALGARTETEALTLAMDVALEMAAFAEEVRAGSARMFGRGGFTNRFDRDETLDFTGFEPEEAQVPTPHRRRAGRAYARREAYRD